MYCDECGKVLNNAHVFYGWGFACYYCSRCCPLEVDGTACNEEHPDDNIQILKQKV
jgi:hypothetical protein